ncbi:MAG: squalene/phytoene synthase family protein [Flavobacteriaceae bacterium]|jgi:15-cis-phytoene synthase|nr:squalene/phytoene synthase family protein [Flavobacteriaceae bacterium]
MKEVFDLVSFDCSKLVTRSYSTSFSMGTSLLGKKVKRHIYNIYGFVRFADEIVDSFHKFNKKDLLDKFENDLFYAMENKISLNPILNSFQFTVNENNIEIELINSFMKSMRLDLHKSLSKTESEYKKYIYGSADVVGLMCLKVFVRGDIKKYNQLKANAMALGSAFQKVNFLRDLKTDSEVLKRNYFPNVNVSNFDEKTKQKIIVEIENDFKNALEGINKLPDDSRLGVYTAYKYYNKLLLKLKRTPSLNIKKIRIRIPNYQKFGVLAKSYLKFHLKLI